MATSVIIVQHAEKQTAPGDPGLTSLGRTQAIRTAAMLAASSAPAALVSSPLRRAMETADLIAEQVPLRVQVDVRLRERMNWHSAGSQPLDRFLLEWSRASRERDYVPASGDSSRQAGDRFLDAIDDLADGHPDATVVVVSHGGVTVDLLRNLIGDDAVEEAAPALVDQGVPCCAVTTLERSGARWSVTDIASTSHLEVARPHRGSVWPGQGRA